MPSYSNGRLWSTIWFSNSLHFFPVTLKFARAKVEATV
jgi:hypothetical protein